MNSIQIAIIGFIVIVIMLTLAYYWYDDISFKKRVARNFNQASATEDVLTSKSQATVMSAVNSIDIAKKSQIGVKDIHLQGKDDLIISNPKVDDDLVQVSEYIKQQVDEVVVPEDSAEAFFVHLDKINFVFATEVDPQIDLVVDVVFEEVQKIRMLPDLSQFTTKKFAIYILDKSDTRELFERGKKYYAKAFKVVLQLVDHEGIINQPQVENIYHNLHEFVINRAAHIRCSDYVEQLLRLQDQVKALNNLELVLELYWVTKNPFGYSQLKKIFQDAGLRLNSGKFDFIENDEVLFVIADENNLALKEGKEYNLFSIVSKLHLQTKPFDVVNKIFDLGENLIQQFESRMLTTNKQVLGQREYDQLQHYIKNFVDNARRKQVELGGSLVKRVFNN